MNEALLEVLMERMAKPRSPCRRRRWSAKVRSDIRMGKSAGLFPMSVGPWEPELPG